MADQAYCMKCREKRYDFEGSLVTLANGTRATRHVSGLRHQAHEDHRHGRRQTLSEQIGASGEVITRTLKEMSREGLIRTATGVIEILDANKFLDLDEAATGRRMFELPPSKAAAQ